MVMPRAYGPTYTQAPRRTAPFGWSGPIVLLVGAALLAIGMILIVVAFLSFLTGVVSASLSDSPLSGIFSSFFGVLFVGAIGVVLTTVGGWLVRFWWIFLIVDLASGGAAANTAAGRQGGQLVMVRCRNCGALNYEGAPRCVGCSQPV